MLLKVDYLINNKEKKITCLFYKRTFYKNEKKQDIKIQLSRLNSVQSEHISTVKKQYMFILYIALQGIKLCVNDGFVCTLFTQYLLCTNDYFFP